MVRPFAGDGVRVSIGEAEANDRLVAVAARFGPQPQSV
jgi:histidinol-phosphate aminotransferase